MNGEVKMPRAPLSERCFTNVVEKQKLGSVTCWLGFVVSRNLTQDLSTQKMENIFSNLEKILLVKKMSAKTELSA